DNGWPASRELSCLRSDHVDMENSAQPTAMSTRTETTHIASSVNSIDPLLKFCPSCHITKLRATFFGRDSHTSDGYRRVCSQCTNSVQRQRRANISPSQPFNGTPSF